MDDEGRMSLLLLWKPLPMCLFILVHGALNSAKTSSVMNIKFPSLTRELLPIFPLVRLMGFSYSHFSLMVISENVG
jgi:hypothetical protein